MTFRKIKAGRVNFPAEQWVGDPGTMFYDELSGELRLADGVTPGGQYVASIDLLNGLANVRIFNANIDGNLTVLGTTSTQNNQIINNEQTLTGTLSVTGNASFTGNSIFTGPTEFVGNTNFTGNTRLTGWTSQIGNLEITGNTLHTGRTKHIISELSGITGAINITGNEDGSYQIPINDGVMLHVTGQPNRASRIYNDAQNDLGSFVVRRYNGTALAPTRVLKDQDIMRISAVGYANTYMPQFGSSRIVFVANEDHTDSAQGGRLEFWVNPNGETVLQRIANVTASNGIWSTVGFVGPLTGNVAGNISGNTAQFTSNVSSGNLSVTNRVTANTAAFSGNVSTAGLAASGTVGTPRVIYSAGGISDLGANTAPVINFGVHSLVRVTNPEATVAASLTNYVAGAHVRLIVQMTTARQIDLGVATSNNSTIADTSLPTNRISNNQCVIIDYYCVDGTANGTYAAVHYA